MNNKILGIVAVVAGAILLVLGINASNAFGSELKEAVTGTPTDEAIWYLIGGGVLLAIGLGLLFMGRRRS